MRLLLEAIVLAELFDRLFDDGVAGKALHVALHRAVVREETVVVRELVDLLKALRLPRKANALEHLADVFLLRRECQKLREFAATPLLGLETEIAVYRDFFLMKNQYEQWQEYWTEFSSCLETDRFVAAAGSGGWRFLICKDSLSETERDALSQAMQNIFAFSYRRSRTKGGKPHG